MSWWDAAIRGDAKAAGIVPKIMAQRVRLLGFEAVGPSLAIRHVDSGSCNGCEHELTLASGPHYDLQRYGLSIVASPRHADVLLVAGTVTTRMHNALLLAYHAMPEPRQVAALGNCALGINILGTPTELLGPVSDILPVDVTIPGCPPRPDQIADALLTLIDARPPTKLMPDRLTKPTDKPPFST